MDAEEPLAKSDPLKLSVIAFTEKRHTESIEGISTVSHPWRMKERVITNIRRRNNITFKFLSLIIDENSECSSCPMP